MNRELKIQIERAIEKVINKNCENGSWDSQNLLHPKLLSQMTDAAELVFDSAQDAQIYFVQEELG